MVKIERIASSGESSPFNAKFADMFRGLIEDVPIAYPSPEIDVGLFSQHRLNAVYRDLVRIRTEKAVRSYEERFVNLCLSFVPNIRESKIDWQFVAPQIETYVTSHFLGGSDPRVVPLEFKNVRLDFVIPSNNADWSCGAEEHESALDGHQGFPIGFVRFLHGAPLEKGDNPVAHGSDCYHNRKYRDDCIGMSLVMDISPPSHNYLQGIRLVAGVMCVVFVIYGVMLLHLSFGDESSSVMLFKGLAYLLGGWVGAIICLFHFFIGQR